MNANKKIEDVHLPGDSKKEPTHIHIFRKEYPRCLIRGCNATNKNYPKPMVGN